jgi:hypothetical protein
MEVGGHCHTLAALPPGKTMYLLYRRLGGPHRQSGGVQKILPPPEVDPRTVQPLASSYTTTLSWPIEQEVLGRKSSLSSSSLAMYIPVVHICLNTLCACAHHPHWLCTFLWFTCVWTPVYVCMCTSCSLAMYIPSVHVFGLTIISVAHLRICHMKVRKLMTCRIWCCVIQ